ncbi:MAG: DoxX family protein [Acidobacteria bacterium]|nr:DoxX family protein [Acidobacteriota bacterium]
MKPILSNFHPQIYAIFRLVIGLLFAIHGTQKLLGFPPSDHPAPPIASIFGLSGIIELVCGILIAIGLLGSIAAFIASGEMAVAYFMAHAGKGGFLPIQNGGELAVVYCFVFLFIAAYGSGIYSVDAAISRNKR